MVVEFPHRLLRNRNFVLLWCAYAVSAFGDHVSEMAILKTFGANQLDVDVTPLSARMTFMFFVPFFLLGPLAGLLADWLPRQSVMIAADIIRCVIMFAFGLLLALVDDWGTWGQFTPLLLVGLFAALFSPARSALLPTVIRPEQLVRANGMISGLGIIATMAAALAGGYLAEHYQPSVAFKVDAGTFVVSALFLMGITLPQSQRSQKEKPSVRMADAWGDLRGGARYALVHRRVLELIAVASLVWFSGALVNSVIPAVVRDVYGGGYQAMSGYRAFVGLGFVIGAIFISILGNALRSEIAITWGLFGIACGMGIFATSVFLPFDSMTLATVGAVGVVLGGASAVTVMASFNSLLQRIVADRFRGRVFGIKDLCSTGALLLATAALGVPQWTRVDRWVDYILIGVALMACAAGVITLLVRLHRGEHGPGLTFAQNSNEFLAKFWWRFQREGRSTIPRTGPIIVAANHRCSADPLFLCASAPYRPISFMVAAEYVNWPVIRFFLRLVECIPVKRSGQDTAAFRQAMRHLREGKAMGIFIEGGIVEPGEVPEPKDGVALLALKTGAKVVPAHISGTKYRDGILSGLFVRHRACVRMGKPIDVTKLVDDLKNRESVAKATEAIYRAILALAPPDHSDVHNAEII